MKAKLDASKLTLGLKKEINKENSPRSLTNEIETAVSEVHHLSQSREKIETELTKRTTLDIPKSLHKKFVLRALDKELSLKDYFIGLGKQDLGIR